jgi:signal peptidase I
MKNWARANKGFIAFLMLFGIFRTAVADWNPIPSASMHPNLLEGDVVFVNRLAYNVKLPLDRHRARPDRRAATRRHRHLLVAGTARA